jgi:hypothetical protein
MPHGLEPPHRPHMGGTGEELLAVLSPPTAKTLSDRAVLLEPHSGHFTADVEDIDLVNCSNFASQDLQVYS